MKSMWTSPITDQPYHFISKKYHFSLITLASYNKNGPRNARDVNKLLFPYCKLTNDSNSKTLMFSTYCHRHMACRHPDLSSCDLNPDPEEINKLFNHLQ